MGRRKLTLKKKDYDKIRSLAERGVREVDMCKAIGISFPTWARLKQEDEKAIQVFEEAKRVEEEKLAGMLYERAIDKNDTTAAMFLLKTRHGYREGADVTNANQVNVKISVPGSMKAEDYLKEVTNDE